MIKLTKEKRIFDQRMAHLCLSKDPEQTIVFYRNGLLFAFNFNPSNSLTNVLVPVPDKADYTVALCSDDEKYGGNNLVEHITYPAKEFDGQYFVELYIPARTAIVLEEKKKRTRKTAAKKTADETAEKPKRGRKKKAAEEPVTVTATEEAPKKRGRKKKVTEETAAGPVAVVETAEKPKRTRKKAAAETAQAVTEEAPKKRGRKKKVTEETVAE